MSFCSSPTLLLNHHRHRTGSGIPLYFDACGALTAQDDAVCNRPLISVSAGGGGVNGGLGIASGVVASFDGGYVLTVSPQM